MKAQLLITLSLWFLLVPVTFSQVNLFQDSPDTEWKSIENEHFKIIFPEHAIEQAQLTLGLLSFYRDKVQKSFQIKTKQIPIVLRASSASANGFVTLGPRRSEWFMSQAFSPFVGSLNWYQSLAIHEFRHVVQFDMFNRSNLRLAYYFGGENFLNSVLNLSIPLWFFEGDAVWTETILSNAGRGRSPRFMSRLKALLTSDYTPSLDQLLAGDYTLPLPNHYVYGYVLITSGIAKFGTDIWYHVSARAADEPLNPFALYDAFYEMTGMDFDLFYQHTMQELKNDWHNINQPTPTSYLSQTRPLIDQDNLYYLSRDLDHQWQLVRDRDKKVLTEVNISPSFSKTDLKNDTFLYTQSILDNRYGYKSFSDLYYYDVKNDQHQRMSFEKRYYHPQFNKAGNKIVVTQYDEQNQWNLLILNKKAEILEKIPSPPNQKLMEAVWKNEKELFAITLAEDGMKKISLINLQTKEINDLTVKTRNNIYSLQFNKYLYFEADDQGVVNIFKYDIANKIFFRCTREKIGGHTPYADNSALYYSSENSNGKVIKKVVENCVELASDKIFKNYIGTGPSDSYTKTKSVEIKDFSNIPAKTESITDYPEYEKSFTPHSWSFTSNRGTQLQAQTTNVLGTLSLLATVGRDAEEKVPFYNFALLYSKFYPIFTFAVQHNERKIEVLAEDVSWSEKQATTQMILPYLFQNNLYYGLHKLTLFGNYIDVSRVDTPTNAYELSDENLTGLGVSVGTSYQKSMLSRELQPRWSYDINFLYEDIKQSSDAEIVNYIGKYDLAFTHPSFFNLDGFKWSLKGEYRPKNELLYRTQDHYFPLLGYTFSRGYGYEFTPRFNKYSLEYTAPLFYPNWGLGEWIYLKRIYATLFRDHTVSDFNRGSRVLNSSGAELNFNTMVFRKFPLKIGLRYIHLDHDQSSQGEFFITI